MFFERHLSLGEHLQDWNDEGQSLPAAGHRLNSHVFVPQELGDYCRLHT